MGKLNQHFQRLPISYLHKAKITNIIFGKKIYFAVHFSLLLLKHVQVRLQEINVFDYWGEILAT